MNLVWFDNTGWRETGRELRVGPFDSRLFVFFVIYFFNISWLFFWLAIIAMLIGYGLSYTGYTMPNALRRIRVLIGGKKRYAVHYWRQRKWD